MGMQYDVKAVERTTTGTAVTGPTRLKGLVVSFATGGTVELKDGGASGVSRFKYTAPAAAGTTSIFVPGEGVRFDTDMHVTLSSATTTIFHG